MPEFQYITIPPLASTPFQDETDRFLYGPAFPPDAPAIFAWADVPLAQGWIARGQALLNDYGRLNPLNDVAGMGDALSVRQTEFVFDVAEAVANAYNALNICWHNDPAARRVYRAWFSGPPTLSNRQYALFGAYPNYGDSWYTAQLDGRVADLPVLGQSRAASLGRLARDAIELFQAFAPTAVGGDVRRRTLELFMDVGFTLTVPVNRAGGLLRDAPDPRTASLLVAYDAAVMNAPFVFGSNGRCPTLPAFPTCLADAPRGVGVLPGTRERVSYPDWRVFYFDAAFAAVPLKVAPPLASYLGYLAALLDVLASRPPEQIILESRAYVIYQNAQMVAASGGVAASAIAAAAQTNATAESGRHQTDVGVQTAATSVTALLTVTGGALAATGIGALPGAVLGVIGGAVALGNTLYQRLHETAPPLYKDDLGRWKPLLERGWLAGDPSDGSVNNRPDMVELRDPPGWTRPRSFTLSTILAGLGLTTTPSETPGTTPAPDATAPGSIPWPVWAAGGLIAGGVAYSLAQKKR